MAAHAVLFGLVWLGLMVAKPLLGYTLKAMAHFYKAHYISKYAKTAGTKINRSPLDRPAAVRTANVVSAGGAPHSKAE